MTEQPWGPDDTIADLPFLAEVARRMQMRPYWQLSEPLPVEPTLYDKAFGDMKAHMKVRGYSSVQTADPRSLPHENFLLFGIPVVKIDG